PRRTTTKTTITKTTITRRRRQPAPTTTWTRRPSRPKPTSTRSTRSPRARPSRATTQRRRTDGSEGEPVRVPARRHHRLEVALVRGPQGVRRVRHRGLADPQLPHDRAAAR